MPFHFKGNIIFQLNNIKVNLNSEISLFGLIPYLNYNYVIRYNEANKILGQVRKFESKITFHLRFINKSLTVRDLYAPSLNRVNNIFSQYKE